MKRTDDQNAPEGIPRVLFLNLAHRYGGTTTRSLEVLKSLPAGTATLASLAGRAVTVQARIEALENIIVVASHKMDPRILWRLCSLIKSGGYQVIDAQNPQSKFWGGLASLWTGAALVSTLNSWPRNEHLNGVRGLIYQWLDWLTRPLTDLYVTVSDDIGRKLLDDGVSPERIEIVPNAIALDTRTVSGDPTWLRETYRLPSGSPVCCAVGRLVPAKGYPTLLDAMARLAEMPLDLHCLIVGSGELHESLNRRIASLGLGQRVRLLGHCDRNDTLRIVKSSDMFVMPSYSEGMPLALLEAAVLGRPIVATRVGGIPQMLVDGEHALLVDPGDAEALAAMLARFCSQPDAARQLGLRAEAAIAQRYSIATQTEALLRAYRRAMNLRRRGMTAMGMG